MTTIDATSAAMRQYRAFKQQYGDCLLLFRLGDVYEAYYADAATAARVLGLHVSTPRRGGDDVPVAGLPVCSINECLVALVKAGVRVAVCDRSDERHSVVRQITPGSMTQTEPTTRDAAKVAKDVRLGLCEGAVSRSAATDCRQCGYDRIIGRATCAFCGASGAQRS